MSYKLIHGSLKDADNGICEIDYFDTEQEALDFANSLNEEVIELRYPDGKIYTLADGEEY